MSTALIIKPTFFAPLAPPIGPSLLKSYCEQRGHAVTVVDLNTVPKLWQLHAKYFQEILRAEGLSRMDHGYSRFWWVLTLHCLAVHNGALGEDLEAVLRVTLQNYGFRDDDTLIDRLRDLVDTYVKDLDDAASGLAFERYDIVGTSTYTTSLPTSLQLLRIAKQRNPGVLTVMGGGVFSSDFALSGENYRRLEADYRFVDHFINGEGEGNLLRLLDGERPSQRLITVAGRTELMVDMATAPAPDFSDVDVGSYMHLAVEGSRSCPFQCAFCSETLYWGQYRKKPVERLVREMGDSVERFKCNSLFMADSLINPLITPLAEALIRQGLTVKLDGYLRADKTAQDPSAIATWARAGLSRVRIGAESASQRILDLMVKKTTPELMSNTIRLLASAGIRVTTYWIVGYPGETDQEFEQTLRFIEQHQEYLYEVEPHLYETYETGQNSSQKLAIKPLLPEQVTAHTHFQVWDTLGSPTRETRFDRLDRLVSLTSRLGIPNIYSMADWYRAEKRWKTNRSRSTLTRADA